MKHKFDKYYEDYDNSKSNKLFEFAAILDPRVKLTIIEYGCAKNCELMKKDGKLKTDKEFKEKVKEMVDGVESEMHKLLREYEDLEPASSSIPVNTVEQGRGKKQWMGKLEQFRGVAGQSSSKKTELEKYLLEDLELMNDEFDILLWWKVNSTRYPTLARMAKDILAIPVSTVASESAFSTGGRVVECYRSSLSPTIVEALICTQDWIRPGRKEINEEEEYEKFDEFTKDVYERIEKMKIELRLTAKVYNNDREDWRKTKQIFCLNTFDRQDDAG
ncbi:zinc finger BED domain-containing protein RICESLEEPER 2-like [Helianthus annuus]|uniref:zinc finger BED domain-containing protein RICESLEEPER 2-like n=1 Tax=Helianthus annuus TaxID=4232 RepID=UPI001652CBB9|nr:zinc finger BED domain-containing protein RICESLEEPER 2-like [Helianthus annuus]